MSPNLTHAADVSVWDGNITEPQWEKARQDGIGLAIVGSWHGTRPNIHAGSSLAAARNAGLSVATYVALNDRAGPDSVERGLEAAKECRDLLFVALDVEVEGVTIDIIHDAVRAVETLELVPIIYTGEWFWKGKFGDPGNFSHVPLWTSRYDGFADLLVSWESYGGWKTPVGKQYQGTNHTLGFGSDLSVFDLNAITTHGGDSMATGDMLGGDQKTTCSYEFEKHRIRVIGWQCWCGDKVGRGKTLAIARKALRKALGKH